MNESKKQTKIMIGIALLVIAGIMLYISLSQPRVYSGDDSTAAPTDGVSTYENNSQTTSVKLEVKQDDVTFPVNLNTATVSELQAIDGIGEKRAAQIIAYREAKGGFKSVDEIKNIKGFGDSLFEQISPYLTV